MKTAAYKLAGEIPAPLLGTMEEVTAEDGTKSQVRKPYVIQTREAESDTDILALVENNDPSLVRKLAQGQLDIIVQRNIRNFANGEEVRAALGIDADGNAVEGAEPNIDEALKLIQDFADTYTYGGSTRAPGKAAETKAKAVKADKIAAAAANDPELAAKLAALGITL